MKPGGSFRSRAGRLKFDAREENGFFSLPLLADYFLNPKRSCPTVRETFSGNKSPGYEYS
jgi:hypothetical protein